MLDDLLSRWPLIQQIKQVLTARSGIIGADPESADQASWRGSDAIDLSLLWGGLRTAGVSQNRKLISIEAILHRLFCIGTFVPRARTPTNCTPIPAG